MNLIIPVPTQTLGPLYAEQIAACFNKLDSHNHTFGEGSQIPLSALTVSQALPMNNYPISNASYVSLAEQITSPTQTGSLYMQGGELYFRNGAGTFDIKMTNGPVVNVPGTAGFAGLLPPASATYAGSDFVFQSGTNIAGNLDAASIKIRNTNPSSNAITINAPNPLPADYSMTLPTSNPATNSFLMVDSSGTVTNNVAPDGTTIQIVGNQLGVVPVSPSAPNYVESASWSVTQTTAGVATLTSPWISLTTTKNLVMLGAVPATLSQCAFRASTAAAAGAVQNGIFFTWETDISTPQRLAATLDFEPKSTGTAARFPPSAANTILSITPGARQFRLTIGHVYSGAGFKTLAADEIKIFAYELT